MGAVISLRRLRAVWTRPRRASDPVAFCSLPRSFDIKWVQAQVDDIELLEEQERSRAPAPRAAPPPRHPPSPHRVRARPCWSVPSRRARANASQIEKSKPLFLFVKGGQEVARMPFASAVELQAQVEKLSVKKPSQD